VVKLVGGQKPYRIGNVDTDPYGRKTIDKARRDASEKYQPC
jgi:hypothetical protein